MADGISIAKAAKIVGVEIHTLRYWENEFHPYLNPLRTVGHQRRYREADVVQAMHIMYLLKVVCFTIAGAKRQLEAERKVELEYNG